MLADRVGGGALTVQPLGGGLEGFAGDAGGREVAQWTGVLREPSQPFGDFRGELYRTIPLDEAAREPMLVQQAVRRPDARTREPNRPTSTGAFDQ